MGPMSRSRSRAASAALATLLSCLFVCLAAATPANAAAGAGTYGSARTSTTPATADTDEIRVTITSLSPSYLGPKSTVVLSGTVTNRADHAWTETTAYLVIPGQPLSSRGQLKSALAAPSAVTGGERLLDLDAIAKIGDLGNGETKDFTLTVPHRKLGISGADGVYPIGTQILATDDDGGRSNEAVGRADTLIPKVADSVSGDEDNVVDVSVVYAFTATIRRQASGKYDDTSELVADIGRGGRLRRLLDLARADASKPATVVVDPALLIALDDIARDSFGADSAQSEPTADAPDPSAPTPSADETEDPGKSNGADGTSRASMTARAFLDDLVAYAKGTSVWATSYGQPDMQALIRASSQAEGRAVARSAARATTVALKRFDLSARRVFWPTNSLTSRKTLTRVQRNGGEDERTNGDPAAIVSPRVLPGWTPSTSSRLAIRTSAGDVPTLVRDPSLLTGGNAGNATLEARQRILSESALASISKSRGDSADVQQRRDVTAILDGAFNPGAGSATAGFAQVFDAPWVNPTDVNRALMASTATWSDPVAIPARITPTPIPVKQVETASSIVTRSRALSAVLGDDPGLRTYYDQVAGLGTSQTWRNERAAGLERSARQLGALRKRADRVSVDTTPVVTLSGKRGRVPLTITNDLGRAVTVGVRIRSDNRALELDDVKPLRIAANQRQTLTVDVNGKQISNSTVTAVLTTPEGKPYGEPIRFNVRSSSVGRTVNYIAMGLAAALVLFAFGRRFRGRRKSLA